MDIPASWTAQMRALIDLLPESSVKTLLSDCSDALLAQFVVGLLVLLFLVLLLAFARQSSTAKRESRVFTVDSLYNYPIKSCGVEPINFRDPLFGRLQLNSRGAVNDRRWMIVEPDGRFITQRQHPAMVRIEPRVKTSKRGDNLSFDTLTLSAPGMDAILVVPKDENSPNTVIRKVEVWNSVLDAVDEGDDVAHWLSRYLDLDVRLVRVAADMEISKRELDYTPEHQDASASPRNAVQPLSFVDSCSLLLISQASLNDLNARLASRVSFLNFRPNIIITGCDAYEEDSFAKIQIGRFVFDVVCRKTRCLLTTVNPQTGVKSSDREPFSTLCSYRRFDGASRPSFGIELCLVGMVEDEPVAEDDGASSDSSAATASSATVHNGETILGAIRAGSAVKILARSSRAS